MLVCDWACAAHTTEINAAIVTLLRLRAVIASPFCACLTACAQTDCKLRTKGMQLKTNELKGAMGSWIVCRLTQRVCRDTAAPALQSRVRKPGWNGMRRITLSVRAVILWLPWADISFIVEEVAGCGGDSNDEN